MHHNIKMIVASLLLASVGFAGKRVVADVQSTVQPPEILSSVEKAEAINTNFERQIPEGSAYFAGKVNEYENLTPMLEYYGDLFAGNRAIQETMTLDIAIQVDDLQSLEVGASGDELEELRGAVDACESVLAMIDSESGFVSAHSVER